MIFSQPDCINYATKGADAARLVYLSMLPVGERQQRPASCPKTTVRPATPQQPLLSFQASLPPGSLTANSQASATASNGLPGARASQRTLPGTGAPAGATPTSWRLGNRILLTRFGEGGADSPGQGKHSPIGTTPRGGPCPCVPETWRG